MSQEREIKSSRGQGDGVRYVKPPRNRPDYTPRIPSEPLTQQLLIRLTESVGLLPAGYVYELPAFEAHRLIARRKAIVVGSVGTIADLVLGELEVQEAGIA